MNKKYVAYSMLIASLVSNLLLFPMHRALFMGAKAIGVGMLPAYGLYTSHKKYSEYKHFHNEIEKTGNVAQSLPKRLVPLLYKDGIERPLSPLVEEFVRKRMVELNIPNAESLAIGTFYCDEIMTIYDKAVLIGEPLAISLEMALKADDLFSLSSKDSEERIFQDLKETQEAQEMIKSAYNQGEIDSDKFHEVQQKLSSVEKKFSKILYEERALYNQRKKSIDDTINETNDFLSHEAGHLFSKDHLRGIYASAVIPTAVQAGWSTIGLGLKKMFPTYGPLTLKQTVLRSAGSVGSIVPKLGIAFIGEQFYRTVRERAADNFGYSVSNKQELELIRDLHLEAAPHFDETFYLLPKKELTKKDTLLRYSIAALVTHHPDPMTRATDAQKHIDKLDAEHPGDRN